eukprot:COSAG02_NODE_36283_length_456_cov_1.770308_1_plen_51_part_10
MPQQMASPFDLPVVGDPYNFTYAIHPRSISLSSNAHHAPGALKCRMVSEGR